MCGGSPSVPSAPPPPPPPPAPPTPIDARVTSARKDEQDRLRAARGRRGTILTGNLGLDENGIDTANVASANLSGT